MRKGFGDKVCVPFLHWFCLQPVLEVPRDLVMATGRAMEMEPGKATAGAAVTMDTVGSSVWTASMGTLTRRGTTPPLSAQVWLAQER